MVKIRRLSDNRIFNAIERTETYKGKKKRLYDAGSGLIYSEEHRGKYFDII